MVETPLKIHLLSPGSLEKNDLYTSLLVGYLEEKTGTVNIAAQPAGVLLWPDYY